MSPPESNTPAPKSARHPSTPSALLVVEGNCHACQKTAAQNWRPAKKEGEHGTHVAGIVGGRGTASGFRGVAPGVTLRSYRVFPDTGGGASNFDIAKAIDTAIADKCDTINMSLGGGPKDDLTRAAIIRALNSGAIVVVAAGNDDRDPVSFPVAFTECTAVFATGRIGSFPKTAIGTSSVATPKGNQPG
jgi:subtilisin